MKTKWLALFAALVLVTPLCVMAQEGAPGREGRGPERGRRGPEMGGRGPMMGGQGAMGTIGPIMRLQRELNVTDEQREQLRAIMETHRDTGRPAMEKLRDAHQALNALAEADEVDEAAIRAKAAEVGAALADVTLMQAKLRKDIRAVLTAEQLKKLDAMRAEMRERMEQRRNERGKRREGARRGGRRGAPPEIGDDGDD